MTALLLLLLLLLHNHPALTRTSSCQGLYGRPGRLPVLLCIA
jgi:hypothetical protein